MTHRPRATDAARPYIGLMSGTSLDGVDAVMVSFDTPQGLVIHGHRHLPFADSLRDELLALNRSGPDELHRAALATNALMQVYAGAVHELLAITGRPAVRALGAHGQTVRHRPREFDGRGYTRQLADGALLAELTGIDVVCDFRSRDVAAGGQGAPLVPAFHAAVWQQAGLSQAVLNIGGIANLTLLPGDGSVQGFDCGPGNVLMDGWISQHHGQPFDPGGAWASQGTVDPGLLDRLLAEPFFAKRPPKSTGRDLFHSQWLAERLAQASADGSAVAAAGVQATLAEFTARVASQALRDWLPDAARLLVCGGGALNQHLMQRLQHNLPATQVLSTQAVGIGPMQVEAIAFAWLARAFMMGLPGNCPEVTGAAGRRSLGALYPA